MDIKETVKYLVEIYLKKLAYSFDVLLQTKESKSPTFFFQQIIVGLV